MTDRQIHPLNESRVQSSREAYVLQRALESGLCQEAHHVGHPHQLAPSVIFLDLTVDKTRCSLPSKGFGSTTPHLSPVSKMSGQRVEVQV